MSHHSVDIARFASAHNFETLTSRLSKTRVCAKPMLICAEVRLPAIGAIHTLRSSRGVNLSASTSGAARFNQKRFTRLREKSEVNNSSSFCFLCECPWWAFFLAETSFLAGKLPWKENTLGNILPEELQFHLPSRETFIWQQRKTLSMGNCFFCKLSHIQFNHFCVCNLSPMNMFLRSSLASLELLPVELCVVMEWASKLQLIVS